ncbi:MAG TPA: colanic acid biosynthesis glycosyltransferase WcaL, partial [Phormidium sp.]
MFNQIIGLLQRGHHVDIYADQLSREERETTKIHSEVEENNLHQFVKYRPDFPAGWASRFLSGLYLFLGHGWKAPRVVLRCLNFIKYGRQATSLKLLHWAIPSLSQPAYDIIHCHFGTFAVNGAVLKEIKAIQGKLITTFHGGDVNTDP